MQARTKHRNMAAGILLAVFCVLTLIGFTNTSAKTIPEVETILNSMTLHEKICQMFISYQYTLPALDANGENTTQTISKMETGNALKKTLEKYPIGGILYDAGSMQSHEQLTDLVATTDSYSKIPMLFTIDEEGGTVARIGNSIGYARGAKLKAMGTYESQGTQTAYDNAKFLAQNIADHGFNLDFAPVADTNSNPKNPVIGTRAYSTNFDNAATLVASAVTGFHDGGVACTLKHFPGHGDTSSDTHAGSVFVYKSIDEIRKNELKPFQAGIDNGADAVMIAHIVIDELGEPCLFSHEIITDLLRNEMNFDGVVISDGLTMKAMTDEYDSEEISLRAINAGCDILLCIEDMPAAIEYITECVENGTITEERIDESVRRILTLKYNRGILD
ncbi:MAG: glycoside hydrolase family 3 [Clostridia bacterium]|nr:glycoside hydrolase family 3 [Clostridia bacterium]